MYKEVKRGDPSSLADMLLRVTGGLRPFVAKMSAPQGDGRESHSSQSEESPILIFLFVEQTFLSVFICYIYKFTINTIEKRGDPSSLR